MHCVCMGRAKEKSGVLGRHVRGCAPGSLERWGNGTKNSLRPTREHFVLARGSGKAGGAFCMTVWD